MILNRTELLNELQLKTEVVELSEGKEVIVSEIGASDMIDLWEATEIKKDGSVDVAQFGPLLVARAVVDEAGERILTEDDVSTLVNSSRNIFDKILEAASRLNGVTGKEAKN